jgi:hypothetical protein
MALVDHLTSSLANKGLTRNLCDNPVLSITATIGKGTFWEGKQA